MLEDLPRGVALEWAARRKPDFWWNVRGADGQPDVARIDEVLGRFRSIHASVLALRFEDDPFATVAATETPLGSSTLAAPSAPSSTLVPSEFTSWKRDHDASHCGVIAGHSAEERSARVIAPSRVIA